MRKKNSLSAFTLTELIVVVSIMSFLVVGFSNLDFSRLSQKQKVSVESTKLISLIEEARNNALIGKGVGTNLITPESWSIDIDNVTSSGSLEVSYLSGTSISYNSWDSPFPFSISNLNCSTLSDSVDTSTGPFMLTFTGSVGGISGCSDNSYKKLTFDYGVGTFTQSITINTLSGVIEVD